MSNASQQLEQLVQTQAANTPVATFSWSPILIADQVRPRGGVSRHTRCCREPTEQGRATNRSHGIIKQLLTCGSHSVTGPNLSDWLSKAQLEERPGHHLQLHPAASACCKISLPLAVSANKSSESGFTALSAWTRRQTATTSCNSEQKALHTQHGHSCT